MKKLMVWLLAVVVSGLSLACEDGASVPTAIEDASEEGGGRVQASADLGGGVGTQQYCDPYMDPSCGSGGGGGTPPVSYGIQIPGWSLNSCQDLTIGADLDGDGLVDECEWQVANNFAPQLIFHSQEQYASRETYWAAHLKYACTTVLTNTVDYWCTETKWVMRIFYALGYHYDGGQGLLPPHRGDSEFLIVEVTYTPEDDRWKHTRTFMSSHQGSGLYNHSGWWYHNWRTDGKMQYVVNVHGYHRVWVNKYKHANYGSEGTCDDDFGTCNYGWAERVDVRTDANLGELDQPLVTQVTSLVGYPGTECFWCPGPFDGWWQLSDDTTGYYTYLNSAMSRPNSTDTCLNTCAS